MHRAPMNFPTLLASGLARALVLTCAGGLAACGSATPAAVAPDAPATASQSASQSLVGHWTGACSPMGATQGSTVTFDISDTTWAIDFDVFGDLACTAKFATVHIEGPYALGAASSVAAGAHEGKFGFSKKTITPHVDAAAQFLSGASGCALPGFAVGVPLDISVTGCAAMGQRPIAACDADYDLAYVEGDRLTFGARPADNDLCTPAKRPVALSKSSFMRR